MKREVFNRIVKLVGACVSMRSPNPLMQCVRIVNSDGQLSITGVGSIMSAKYCGPGDDSKIDVCVPARSLIDALAPMSDQELSLRTTKAGKLIIECGRIKTSLNSMIDSANLLSIQSDDSDEWYGGFNGSHIANALDVVSYSAADPSSGKGYLTGVNFGVLNGLSSAFAMDGTQLALYQSDFNISIGLDVIVPKVAISAMKRLCAEMGDAEIRITDRMEIRGKDGRFYVAVALLEGRFPDWSQFTGLSTSGNMTVETHVIKGAIRAVESVGSQFAIFDFNESTLTVRSVQTESGAVDIEIDYGDLVCDKPVSIKLPCKALSSAVERGNGQVSIAYTDEKSPVHINSGQFTGVLMPVT